MMRLSIDARRHGDHRCAVRSAFAVGSFAMTLATAALAESFCLAIIALPDNDALTAIPLYAEGATFTVSYRHLATKTPVSETYRADRTGITQIEIRFKQPGSGLPSEPGPGETWTQEAGRTVVTMARRFDGVRLRVQADQAPTLDVAGRKTALSQWGNRAIGIVPSDCTRR
jgi:hypothetical protein